MRRLGRDQAILRRIVLYCDDIGDAVRQFGDDLEVFRENRTYRNACAMCILQIGELCNNLSPEFRAKYAEMPWRQIRGMRNVMAHAYGDLSVQTTWDTIHGDIPMLRGFCERCLADNR